MEFYLRHATNTDAVALAELSGELGYPMAAGEMQQRLQAIATDNGHGVIVACAKDGAIVGWMDLGVVFHLQSGSYCEIGGLVVAASARNNGIGQKLVSYADTWARERGLPKVLVRSNATREDAHRFYLRENYERVKTSAVFEKRLR